MTSEPRTADAVAAFRDDIAAWALPERVAPLLAPGLARETAQRLMRSRTLRAPCSAWLARTLGPVEGFDALDPQQQRLVLADGEVLDKAAFLAAAVWHARRICALVLAPDIAAFVAEHGQAARDAALRHLSLTPAPAEISAPPAAADTPQRADLTALMAADGRACVAAWIDQLPAAIGARVRMKLPYGRDVPPRTPHNQYGPPIVRAIAAFAPPAADTPDVALARHAVRAIMRGEAR